MSLAREIAWRAAGDGAWQEAEPTFQSWEFAKDRAREAAGLVDTHRIVSYAAGDIPAAQALAATMVCWKTIYEAARKAARKAAKETFALFVDPLFIDPVKIYKAAAAAATTTTWVLILRNRREIIQNIDLCLREVAMKPLETVAWDQVMADLHTEDASDTWKLAFTPVHLWFHDVIHRVEFLATYGGTDRVDDACREWLPLPPLLGCMVLDYTGVRSFDSLLDHMEQELTRECKVRDPEVQLHDGAVVRQPRRACRRL
jgi:hypothetical protein